MFHLFRFQGEDLSVDVLQRKVILSGEMSRGNGTEQFLDIVDGKNILKIIDKNQKQDMLFGILLFIGRRQQVVLVIVLIMVFVRTLSS